MELKGSGHSGKKSKICEFQSHLYGIERWCMSSRPPPCPVSIAPLWNWKVTTGYAVAVAGTFQSHLYGIESVHDNIFFRWIIRFNRTFMELKGRHSIIMQGVPRVSIAPLWNWKRSKALRLCLLNSFNRTFMELKDSIRSDGCAQVQCFNRTFMELKGETALYIIMYAIVSIAPLWNWKRAITR